MKPLIALFVCFACLAGCSKKENVTPAPTSLVAAPASSATVETPAEQPAPPPPPPPPSETETPATPAVNTDAEAEKPASTKLSPTMYDNVSAAQKTAADRDRRFRDWALAFRSGSDQQKKTARAGVAQLSAGERAAFEAFCKQYGVKF
jgi:type IV secretory pathway VirB10-like protein